MYRKYKCDKCGVTLEVDIDISICLKCGAQVKKRKPKEPSIESDIQEVQSGE